MVIKDQLGFRYLFIIILLGFSACTKDDNENSTVVARPVIESYLLAGDTANVKITYYVADIDVSVEESVDIETLEVFIIHNESEYLLSYVGNNVYQDTGFVIDIIEDQYYELFIPFGDADISAITYVQPKPQNADLSASSISIPEFEFGSGSMPEFPDPVEITWDNSDNSYYLIVTECIENDPEPINDDDDRPELAFLSEPVSTNYLLIRPMEFQYYGYHNIILYHLNTDYASLYDDMGSSSLDLQEIQSSIENAYGIFTGINSDTLLIKVVD